MNNTLVKQLLNELSNPKDLDKKQISLFLKPDIIKKLDALTRTFNQYSEKKASRNYLIELAVQNLIETFPKAMDEYKKTFAKKQKEYDTVIYPSDYLGITTLVNEKKWYYVRIDEEKIKNIKYIALYLGSPISQITHYAKVKNYEAKKIDGKTKYVIYVEDDIKKLNKPVPLGNKNPLGTRSPKYTTLEKLKTANEFSDLD